MPYRGDPVTRPTVFPELCAAAVVPFFPRCTVQVLLPVPEAAVAVVTIMISDSTRTGKVIGVDRNSPAMGNGVEELTVMDVAELVMAPLSVVVNAVLVKSVEVL